MTMEWRLITLTVVGVLALTAQTFGCSPTRDWVKRSMQWILYRTDIVLYGKDIGRFEVMDTSSGMNRTDMTFKVYCIIKGDNISENITVEFVKPLHSCYSAVVEPGEEAIVGLKRKTNGNFEYQQLGVSQDLAFKPTNETFKLAYQVCGLQNPREPKDRSANATYPECPPYAIVPVGAPCTNTAQRLTQLNSAFLTFIAVLCFLI